MNISKLVSFLKLFVETNMRLRRFKIMDISKKDWKLFRERLSDWQENYMEGLVKEYANFLNDDKKPASEKFWELEKRIKEDKRHPGVIMEMSKSEVIWDIVRLIRLKVIAYDDLSDFSDVFIRYFKNFRKCFDFNISNKALIGFNSCNYILSIS